MESGDLGRSNRYVPAQFDSLNVEANFLRSVVLTSDPRKESTHPSNLRSINLAISARGITALRSVDPSLADELLEEAIPMGGRMIHHKEGGRREAQAYDPKGGEVSL